MRMTVRVIDVLDGRTFLISSGVKVILRGVTVPGLMTLKGRQAKERLEELVLHKHVQCEDIEDDVESDIIAQVWAEGDDVNRIIQTIVGAAPAVQPLAAGTGASAGTAAPEPEKKIDIPIDESAFAPKPPPGTGRRRGVPSPDEGSQ